MRPLAAAALLLVSACSALTPAPSDLDVLAGWMSGSFSSAAQAAADKDYRDIRLHMAPIWTTRTDGRWLYVEQAVAEKLDRPYRQRVYRVHEDGDELVSDVYELPGDPLRFAGAWSNPLLLQDVGPEQLEPRTGCSIRLRRQPDGSFAGSTDGRSCPSDLRGASYATSEVVITAAMLTSWDRGFDASGKQVWGAEKGPYQFAKAAAPR
jgi:hypothetical protein